jgi:hypothetical protein
MPINQQRPHYQIYLLTIWEEDGQETRGVDEWRFRLEDPRTGQQRGFTSLDALAANIAQELADIRLQAGKQGEYEDTGGRLGDRL